MTISNEYQDPNSVSRIKVLVANFLSKKLIFKSKIAYFFTTAGDILRLQSTLDSKFGATKHFSSREILWDRIIERVQADANIYEFGVAYGYTTNYFLTRLKHHVNYQGFDLFTGLPTAWRNLEKGTFSTNGNPPSINDPRLKWIIGDITRTFNRNYEFPEVNQNILLFDFDLFEPTLHAYQVCKSQDLLSDGSIIYFDEAFDPDELHIIQNYIFPDLQLKLIGSTWGAVAFQVGN